MMCILDPLVGEQLLCLTVFYLFTMLVFGSLESE